jgi:hypothetical protein
MSIAALKRKTATQYNNMSVGQSQFSINGTHRSQGYVGQSVISRSLPRTLFNGNVPRGHGGCCGTYPLVHVVQSATTSTNDNKVVKSSVLSNDGMIAIKYRWITRPQPYTTVKPDNAQNNNTQGNYVFRVGRIARQQTPTVCPGTSKYVASRRHEVHPPISVLNITKPESEYTSISQSDYIAQLQDACTGHDIFYFPSNIQRAPFACGSTNTVP